MSNVEKSNVFGPCGCFFNGTECPRAVVLTAVYYASVGSMDF